MTYQVKFMSRAVEDISRLDKVIAQRILAKIRWLSGNFDSLTPEVLTGEWEGLFKLRVGSYRVIYDVYDNEQLVLILQVVRRTEATYQS